MTFFQGFIFLQIQQYLYPNNKNNKNNKMMKLCINFSPKSIFETNDGIIVNSCHPSVGGIGNGLHGQFIKNCGFEFQAAGLAYAHIKALEYGIKIIPNEVPLMKPGFVWVSNSKYNLKNNNIKHIISIVSYRPYINEHNITIINNMIYVYKSLISAIIKKCKIKNISMPLLSTGIFNVSIELSLIALISAFLQYRFEHPFINDNFNITLYEIDDKKQQKIINLLHEFKEIIKDINFISVNI